jgi:DNA-binding protein HU-beta
MNKSEMAVKLAKLEMTQAKAADIVVRSLMRPRHHRGRTRCWPEGVDAGLASSPQKRGPRQGRNPATGKTITIAARKYVVFKAGKTLKDKVAK